MSGLPPLPVEVKDPNELGEAEQIAFYTAAMERGSTGSEELDLLLRKGLYGQRTPKALTGKKAADAFQAAFDLIGGIPRLALWADKNPSAFFSLYSKLIPATVQAQVNATIKVDAPWMNPNRLSYQSQGEIVDVTPQQVKGPQEPNGGADVPA